MLIDMVRENITQRDTDFHDTREGIVLARNWLEIKSSNVKQFNKTLSKRGRLGEGRPKEGKSYRSIANFISKNGKAVSYGTVKNYIDITDNLAPELIPRVFVLQRYVYVLKEKQENY